MTMESWWCDGKRPPQSLGPRKKPTSKEAAVRKRLAEGESGLDIYGWREKLKALGLEYI